jgi:hypothetical protein
MDEVKLIPNCILTLPLVVSSSLTILSTIYKAYSWANLAIEYLEALVSITML